jgi:hypothetical protein
MLLMAMGGSRIISALLLGKTEFFSMAISFADQKLLFIGMLAMWTMVLVFGVSYVAGGVSRFRKSLLSADATQ